MPHLVLIRDQGRLVATKTTFTDGELSEYLGTLRTRLYHDHWTEDPDPNYYLVVTKDGVRRTVALTEF